ncbi:magnesium transporter [Shewanella sp. YLB-07]|uniref:magnesium transporter n=1 Tax=Shewanella sp. YLB-07 TaxID=2601268 RepID=UPI00128B0B1F|nr:magnesium transporter [Shewanella sp. YLB-07]MPY26607.1 magnesium transporter [Shewanella sp. YLB-07]
MPNFSAEIKSDLNINSILNLNFDFWNDDFIQVENDDVSHKLIIFMQEQSSGVIQTWLENKSLLQCFYIHQLLPEAESKTFFRLMPAWLVSDMEKIETEIHPVISAVSTAPHLFFTHDMCVGDAITKIHETKETFNNHLAFIVDDQGCYCAVLQIHQLLKHSEARLLVDIAESVGSCHVSTDREKAVAMLQHSDLDYLPIVDLSGKPVATLSAKKAMEVMQLEQTQDVEMLMGIQADDNGTPYMKTSVLEHVRKRIFWIVGLAGVGILSGMVIQSYEDAITALTILALYMPMVADTGGNAGSQASTVIVRSMALGELKLKNWCEVLWKELRISLFIGLGLACISFIKVYFLSHGVSLPNGLTLSMLGSAIALALFFQVVTATVIGAALPLLAKVSGQDPAVVASPAITTIVDVTGLLIYFYVTSLILLS